ISPVSRSSANRAPSTTATPTCSALVTFDAPGATPTTRANVLFDTLPGDLPPRAMIACSASSRVYPSRPPVTTTDLPVRVWARLGDAPSAPPPGSTSVTPALRSRSTTERFTSEANHRITLVAMTGPTPSTAARRSSLCLLYTSDAADEEDSVDLGGRRII